MTTASPGPTFRILHVITSCDPAGGGPIEGLRQLSAALAPLGVEVEVLTSDEPDAPYLAAQPFKVHPVGPAKTGRFGLCPAMADWLREHGKDFDRIVVNGLWQYNGVAVWKTRKVHGRPYFVFCHGMLDPWFKRRYPLKHLKKQVFWWLFQGKVLRDAAKVLFTSEEERVQAHGGFSPYRMTEQVVQYGTAGLPSQHPTPQHSTPCLLFLGRIHIKKGCDLLIRSFAKIADRDPNRKLVFAGPDQTNWRPELEELANSLGVADRISWLGMVSGEAKWQAFLDAEAFVLPSHQENFGIAVAEALSCGLPVLISDKVNIWREIEADGAGLVEPDDQEGTDRLLAKWVDMSSECKAEMRSKARPCFEERFEIGAAARKLIEVYGLAGGGSK